MVYEFKLEAYTDSLPSAVTVPFILRTAPLIYDSVVD